ncbi:MAG: hypothetical protein L3K13_08620 [Thermoplasmata archaeon]|nr:hypothetical protein [Thermoplasmata archaeon]
MSTAAAGLPEATPGSNVEAWWRSLWVPPAGSDWSAPAARATVPWSEGEVIDFSDEATAAVLRDLAQMQLELRRASSIGTASPGDPPSTTSAAASVKPTPLAGIAPPTGSPSLYLDERLARARVAASGLGRELHRVEADSHGLRESIDRLEGDLGEAVEELAFIRANDWGPAGPETSPGATRGARERAPSQRPGPPPQLRGAPPAVRPVPRRPTQDAPFEAFTSERYNTTVIGLHRRWPRVVWITLLLSAAISLALEAVLLLSREPFPGWWLALLPVIWMLPVPFFMAAFRGTHRVLRETPLTLPRQS